MLNKKQFYINGQWVGPNTPNNFEVINPCNEDPCAVISLGSTLTVYNTGHLTYNIGYLTYNTGYLDL